MASVQHLYIEEGHQFLKALATLAERFHDLPGLIVLLQFPEFKNPGRDDIHLRLCFLQFLLELFDLGFNRRYRPYTTDNGKKLVKPEKQAKYLGIDEFKLHNGRRYATHIIDLESGHVLWIQNGKSKQVVYDFIDHVGMEWMSGVEAVACDMNSDFQEAFEEKCYWIQPVLDYFHIVKNFNDKVVSEVRKDEQKRLYEEGYVEAAKALKKTRYILMSKRSTLQKKDADGNGR